VTKLSWLAFDLASLAYWLGRLVRLLYGRRSGLTPPVLSVGERKGMLWLILDPESANRLDWKSTKNELVTPLDKAASVISGALNCSPR
jgi:hypothetical protein